MRVRSPPEPLRVNVTHADSVHHLPGRRGSDGGEVCSSITAIDPPARTLLKPDTRQRRPPGRFSDSFPAGVGAMAVETETLTRRLRCRQRACEAPPLGALPLFVQAVKVVEFGHFYGCGVIRSLMRSRRIVNHRAPHEGAETIETKGWITTMKKTSSSRAPGRPNAASLWLSLPPSRHS